LRFRDGQLYAGRSMNVKDFRSVAALSPVYLSARR
jgi:hypothetical protein